MKNKNPANLWKDPPKSEIWRYRKQKMRFSRMILKVCWKFWIFFSKKAKSSSKFAIFVKKYEICDFGGWFDNFLSILFGEMGENSFGYDRKKAKRSSKNAKWVFAHRKTRIGLFEDLLIFFPRIYSFYMGTSEQSHMKKDSVIHILL